MCAARPFSMPFQFYIDRMTVKHRNDFLALLGLDLIETLEEE